MKKCTLFTEKSMNIAKVESEVFGSFLEHLGRAVYEGIYEPNSAVADEAGLRKDVIEAVKEMGVSIVRYPGGNFVSNYNWRDGIGPKEKRPRRLELHWQSIETNQFGTDDFMGWCKKTNLEPMLAVNLGSGTMKDAQELVEYCNHRYGTALSDERIQNGYKDPHNVKYWCLGNEVDGEWQAGHMSAIEYAKKAYEAAKLMKWTDENVKVVACGSSSCDIKTYPEWDRVVLEYGYDQFDYIALHEYDWPKGNDLDYFASYHKMDKYIKVIKSTIEYVKAVRRTDKEVYISFDEWNVGDQTVPKKGDFQEAPHLFEQHYTLKDALVMGGMLNTLMNNADTVKIACLAQLVNVVAPIITDSEKGMLKQTIFTPFALASKYGKNGVAKKYLLDSPKYKSCYGETDYVSACVVEHDDYITLFAVNYADEEMQFDATLQAFGNLEIGEYTILDGNDLMDRNTFDNPDLVKTRSGIASVSGNTVQAVLPKHSLNVMKILKK